MSNTLSCCLKIEGSEADLKQADKILADEKWRDHLWIIRGINKVYKNGILTYIWSTRRYVWYERMFKDFMTMFPLCSFELTISDYMAGTTEVVKVKEDEVVEARLYDFKGWDTEMGHEFRIDYEYGYTDLMTDEFHEYSLEKQYENLLTSINETWKINK